MRFSHMLTTCAALLGMASAAVSTQAAEAPLTGDTLVFAGVSPQVIAFTDRPSP